MAGEIRVNDRMRVALEVNGAARVIEVSPVARLLDVLREVLRLTGTKEG